MLNSLVFIIITNYFVTNYFVTNYYLQQEAKGAKKKPITNVSTLYIISKLVTLFKARCADLLCMHIYCIYNYQLLYSGALLYWLQWLSLPELHTNILYMYILCIFACKVLCTQALMCSSAVLSIVAWVPATYTCPCTL